MAFLLDITASRFLVLVLVGLCTVGALYRGRRAFQFFATTALMGISWFFGAESKAAEIEGPNTAMIIAILAIFVLLTGTLYGWVEDRNKSEGGPGGA